MNEFSVCFTLFSQYGNESDDRYVIINDFIFQEFVTEMVDYINYISVQDHVNDRELIKLNKFIEQFYMQAR